MSINNIAIFKPNIAKPKSLIIMFHGYGSTAHRMLAKFHSWRDCQSIIICPEGLEICDSDPKAFQWYSIINRWSNYRKNSDDILHELITIQQTIHDFIMQQAQLYDVELSNVFILGFSQGASVALYCGLLMQNQLAGLILLSGRFLFTSDINIIHKHPILLIHGDRDDVVNIEYFYEAQKFFWQEDFPLESHVINDLDHSVNNQVIKLIRDFTEGNKAL